MSSARIIVLFLALLVLIASTTTDLHAQSETGDFYLLPITERAQVDLIGMAGVSVRHRTKAGAVVRVSDLQLKRLQALGFSTQYLPRDPALPSEDAMTKVSFADNEDVDATFAQIVLAHPDIARRYTIGASVYNRPIYGLLLSRNPDIDEDEVEFRVAGCHHGNEFMSIEIPLALARKLADEYGQDAEITELIDNMEIHIIPLVNPDGRANNFRPNANAVDLNRNYGYQYHSDSYSGEWGGDGPYTQPETRAFADHHFQHNFTLSFSYHTTAAYMNYLWNFAARPTPDETLIIELSERYAEIVQDLQPYDPHSYEYFTAINGYDWYQTYGDTNDFSYGTTGDIDWTIETGNSDIPLETSSHVPALLDALQQARRGLRGVVTDADSNAPLFAMVRCDNAAWPVYTDPDIGDFHRVLPAGTSSCRVWSTGYAEQNLPETTITTGEATRRDISLIPNGRYYGMRVMALTTDETNPTESYELLGPADDTSFSLGHDGDVVVDMALPIRDHIGNELMVHEGAPYGGERYRVYVSNDYPNHDEIAWLYLGEGHGTTSFDLASLGPNVEVRYVRVIDLGDSTSGTRPGADIDAIRYLPAPEQTDGDFDEEVAPEFEQDEEWEFDVEPEYDAEPELEPDEERSEKLESEWPQDGDLDEPPVSDGDEETMEVSETDADSMLPDGDEEAERPIDGDFDSDLPVDGDLPTDGDVEQETPNCQPILDCYDLNLQITSTCEQSVITGRVEVQPDCRLHLSTCEFNDSRRFTLALEQQDGNLIGAQDCRFIASGTGRWNMQGNCGFDSDVQGELLAVNCTSAYEELSCDYSKDPSCGRVDGDIEESSDGDMDFAPPADNDRIELDGDQNTDGDDVDGDDGGSDGSGGGCHQTEFSGSVWVWMFLLPLLLFRRRLTRAYKPSAS